jgi:hypothetical protein
MVRSSPVDYRYVNVCAVERNFGHLFNRPLGVPSRLFDQEVVSRALVGIGGTCRY